MAHELHLSKAVITNHSCCSWSNYRGETPPPNRQSQAPGRPFSLRVRPQQQVTAATVEWGEGKCGTQQRPSGSLMSEAPLRQAGSLPWSCAHNSDNLVGVCGASEHSGEAHCPVPTLARQQRGAQAGGPGMLPSSGPGRTPGPFPCSVLCVLRAGARAPRGGTLRTRVAERSDSSLGGLPFRDLHG